MIAYFTDVDTSGSDMGLEMLIAGISNKEVTLFTSSR